MQKRHMVLGLIGLAVLFSLFQLHNLVRNHSSQLQQSSVIRFKYLTGIHVVMIISLVSILYLDEFYQNAIIIFFFSLFVILLFMACEAQIKKVSGHDNIDDYLILKQNKFIQPAEKTFLTTYFLFQIYSILTATLLGTFLAIKLTVLCYLQRQCCNQLESAVTCIEYSDQLKGKECVICISEFMENKSCRLYQINTCKHIFHVDCIDQWVNQSATCPVCRANIFTSRSNHQPRFTV